MSKPSPVAVKENVCVYCGAEAGAASSQCWMCGRPSPPVRGKSSSDAAIVPAAVVLQPPNFTPTSYSFSIASALTVISLIAVGLGLARIEPGLAMVYAMVALPAFIITAVRTRAERTVKRRQVGWGEQLLTFLLSSMAVFGAFIVMQIALALALFVVCLIAIGASQIWQ
ncbi:MAG: hypothetical protein KDA41_04130 [Planctomycetales bacterium]|nr:hypothetical protein [Planctomycetales bacterium]